MSHACVRIDAQNRKTMQTENKCNVLEKELHDSVIALRQSMKFQQCYKTI